MDMSIGKKGEQGRAAMLHYRLLLSCGLRDGDQGGKVMAAGVLVSNVSSFHIERRSFAG